MKIIKKYQLGNPIEGLDAWEERQRKRVLQLRDEQGLTPIYPEFDLLLGARGLINGAVKEGIKQAPRAAKYIYNAAKKLPYSKTAHNFMTGMIGGLTVDNLNKQLFGKSWGESVSEPVGYIVRKAGWNPDDTLWGRMLANIGTTAAEFTNPGYLLSPAGAKQIGETAYNGAKSLVKSVDKGLRKRYPYYDLYRTVSENTPKRVVDYDYFNDGELIGNTVSNLPILDLGRTLKKQANNSYFFRAPNDIDILKIGNGRYRSNLSFDGQTRLPGGQVNGKFVSYGEPWLEFGLRDDHALYEFPVGQGRPSDLIATDLRGEKLQYSVDLIFNYMQKERLGLIKLFEDEANKLGIYKINDFGEREMALLKLKEEKYPELLLSYDTSIYHANLTVIPNEQWNFENFLKEPFWKYSEDPASGLVQKTLYMNWPSYDDPKASLVLLERNPSKISPAERIGIPKGERNNGFVKAKTSVDENIIRLNNLGRERTKFMLDHPIYDYHTKDPEISFENQLERAQRKLANDPRFKNRTYKNNILYNVSPKKLSAYGTSDSSLYSPDRRYDPNEKWIKVYNSPDDISPFAKITDSHEVKHFTGHDADYYIYEYLKLHGIINDYKMSDYAKSLDKGEIGMHIGELADFLGATKPFKSNKYYLSDGRLLATVEDLDNYILFMRSKGLYQKGNSLYENILDKQKFIDFFNEFRFKQGGKLKSK